jgi:hypothetical protein
VVADAAPEAYDDRSTGAVVVRAPLKTYWPLYWVFSSPAISSSIWPAELITDVDSVVLPTVAALSWLRRLVMMSVIDPTAEYITWTLLSATCAASI